MIFKWLKIYNNKVIFKWCQINSIIKLYLYNMIRFVFYRNLPVISDGNFKRILKLIKINFISEFANKKKIANKKFSYLILLLANNLKWNNDNLNFHLRIFIWEFLNRWIKSPPIFALVHSNHSPHWVYIHAYACTNPDP